VERRDDLDPAERRRFRTGRASLDFTHTGGDGPFARWEILHRPADVARYLGIVLGCEPPRTSRSDLNAALALRSAITTIARTLADGATNTPPQGEVDRLNAAAFHEPLRVMLTTDTEQIIEPGTARAACSTLARDAIDLFGSALRGRIRVCEADDCGLLFVDTSRPGRRRWCSMDWCGDRQKKRRAGRPVRGRQDQTP
jgi:predicted RNA-binding Zn ribbon-like protein